MNPIILLLFVIVSVYGKRTYLQETSLRALYNSVFQIREFVSQLEFYTALEKLEQKTHVDLDFEQESLEIYNEHYAELIHDIELQHVTLKKEGEEIKYFIMDTFPQIIEKLKRIANDKEKLIESDVRELGKLKAQTGTAEEQNRKLEEFSYLQQRIAEGMFDENDIQELFKTLELLESKIMIGLFKDSVSEVQYFMKEVDRIFKEKEHIKRDDLISLLSLMQSVITELRIKLHNEQVENSLDLMDKHIFYAQSKHTHTMAKESYNDLVNILEKNYMVRWQEFDEPTLDLEVLETLKQSNEEQEEIALRSMNYHSSLQSSIRDMMNQFLQR